MKRFRHIGFLRILPEYLLIFGLLFGGFSLSGTLSEAPVSHTEVAYIEMLSERSESAEWGAKDVEIEAKVIQPKSFAPFYSFSFRSINQAYLIHHFLAREKERSQNDQFLTSIRPASYFSHPHIPLYARDDFPIAITA